MGAQVIRPETLEERLVYWPIVGLWGLWLLGALYFTGPVVGYVLLLVAAGRFIGLLDDPYKRPFTIPISVMLWIGGMLVMLIALVIAHIDFQLGAGGTLKSIVGWAKGWALMAIFPLTGVLLSIRPALIYRATGIAALQTLILAPFLFLAGVAGLPMDLYVSPVALLGGPGPEFFDVTLYLIDDTNGALRWRFFGPWATVTAFLASIWLFFALFERSFFWKSVAIVSAIVVCWMAGSRSSIVAIPIVIAAMVVASHFHRPVVLLAIAFGVVGLILTLDTVMVVVGDAKEAFTAARSASSRVRETLNDIGYHRWYADAFWFGHGVIEPGPKLVERMPIGSHHTWYGLLYVKGVVGFIALAVPVCWTLVELGLKSPADRVARAAFGVTVAIVIFSFADNLEIITYLIWPALLLVGVGLKRRYANPYAVRLGSPRLHDVGQREIMSNGNDGGGPAWSR